MIRCKVACWVILFCICPHLLLAGGIIRKGERFVAKQDMRWFTKQEAKKLVAELREKDKLKQQLEKVQSREELYIQEISALRQAENARREATEDARSAAESLKDAVSALKEANVVYKEIVIVQRNIIKDNHYEITKLKRSRRRRTFLSFLSGFIAPVAGAYAMGKLQASIRF